MLAREPLLLSVQFDPDSRVLPVIELMAIGSLGFAAFVRVYCALCRGSEARKAMTIFLSIIAIVAIVITTAILLLGTIDRFAYHIDQTID